MILARIVACVLAVPLLACFGAERWKYLEFDQNCTQRIKQAADANDPKLALSALTGAINFAQDRKCTEGNSGIILHGPEADVGFWYKNLQSCQKELADITSSMTPLERTNVMMKVKEALTDGPAVTLPPNIYIFPDQKKWFGSAVVGLFLLLSGMWLLLTTTQIYQDHMYERQRMRRYGKA